MFQTKRFGLVASKQEYMMLCRAERHRKELEHERKVIQRRLPRAAKTSKR